MLWWMSHRMSPDAISNSGGCQDHPEIQRILLWSYDLSIAAFHELMDTTDDNVAVGLQMTRFIGCAATWKRTWTLKWNSWCWVPRYLATFLAAITSGELWSTPTEKEWTTRPRRVISRAAIELENVGLSTEREENSVSTGEPDETRVKSTGEQHSNGRVRH